MSHTELLQVVDAETGEPTGEHMPRKEVFEKQAWVRTTNIFVLNPQGEILCHQRSLDKERFPGAWSTHFGGHVTKDESFKISALKELEEEIGFKANPFQLIPWRTSKKVPSRIWVRDFITLYSGTIEDLKIQGSEIQSVKWFSPEEVLQQLDSEESHSMGGTQWLAGTHNFHADYQCMRAVLTATLDIGIFGGDFKPLHKWHPPVGNGHQSSH
jgi:isopentenyldiphosphate isomerase